MDKQIERIIQRGRLMGKVRVIEVKESVFAKNDQSADELRERLKKNKTLFVNVMSSPGSGKTTALSALINILKNEYNIAGMDVDIESTLDAQRVADATGIRYMQIHNGGLCHIDADMTTTAVNNFGVDNTDLLILENIGNLVCPAEFDTGAHKNIMILSVPEGDDKPLKYPLMFSVCDLILISKIDTVDFFDFSFENAEKYIRELNPKVEIIPISAKSGEGMDKLADWFRKEIADIKK